MKQNTEMPWTIKVRYKLDGVEYAPSELAGKSGKLEISISIKENKNCKRICFFPACPHLCAKRLCAMGFGHAQFQTDTGENAGA